MSRAAHNPERVWFIPSVIAATLVAIASGYGCYSRSVRQHSVAALGETARAELAALDVTPRATAAVERTWVTGMKDDYLVASHVPMPCAEVVDFVRPHERPAVVAALDAARDPDPVTRIERLEMIADGAPDNMIVALIHGTQLIQAREYSRAEQTLARALARTDRDERILEAAKSPGSTLTLDNFEVSTFIHVHHAFGVAGLTRLSDNKWWSVSLRKVIASVIPLTHRRLIGATRGQPVWSRLLIPAPGCSNVSSQSLSTYDLFNNLIVAYMKGKLPVSDEWRTKEFRRSEAGEMLPLHGLLAAEVKRASGSNWTNVSQLGALSNVERIVAEIHPNVPDDARLAFNSVQVIDWWMKERERKEPAAGEGEGILELRDRLIEQAFRRRNVAPDQRAAFARGALRMLASSGVQRASIAADAAQVREWLTPQDARALDDFLTADAALAAIPKWIVAREEDDEPPQAKLGARAEAWYPAARTDFAASAARWAAERPSDEQRDALVAIRQFLGSADPPPELLALERTRPWNQRMWLRVSASNWFWMLIAAGVAAAVWLVLVWILVHIRERRLLRTSLYDVEYEVLSRGMH